jgi:SAM-dependent methyltransferase
MRKTVRVVLAALLLTVARAQSTVSDEQIWSQFVAWLSSQRLSDNLKGIFDGYAAHLKSQGLPAEDIERRGAAIRNWMRARNDGWRIIFDSVYSATNPQFNTKPNALLISAVEGRKPGRALDAGMGQGRNSVFLAIKGWDVTGFDLSSEGVAAAKRNADLAGVKLDARVLAHEEFTFGRNAWDLIVITYEPFPLTDSTYTRKLYESLRSGGLLVIESFASDSQSAVRRPVDIDPPKLREALAEFEILKFEDLTDQPDWSPTPARLVRAVVQKK